MSKPGVNSSHSLGPERHASASFDELKNKKRIPTYVLERRSPARRAKAEVSNEVMILRLRMSRSSFIHFASDGTSESGFLIGLSGEGILEAFGVRFSRLYNFSNSDGPAGNCGASNWDGLARRFGRRLWRSGS